MEQVNSRPAFVIEATPRAGYQPVDRYSKLYTQLRAKLWIDQVDSRWVKIEAELLDTVNYWLDSAAGSQGLARQADAGADQRRRVAARRDLVSRLGARWAG